MRVSVVVPTLNEEKYILECLEGIRSQSIGCELIVVDSGSTDHTVELAGKLADKVVSGRKNIAFNRQRGVEEATEGIVVSTDADCIHPLGWLEKITKYFKDPGVVAVSGPTVPIPEEACFLDNLAYGIGNSFLHLLHLLGTDWFRGSNTAYRRNALIKAGGYNTSLLAREDSELSERVSKLGKTVYDPSVKVMTSMRRRRKMGWVKTIRYYLDTPISLITGRIYYEKPE